MFFMAQVTDKNGQQLQIGDEVVHVANPGVKGKIVQYGSGSSHYLDSSWIDVRFERSVGFSGNPSRVAAEWSCSACLLEKI